MSRLELPSTPCSVRTARVGVARALDAWPHLQDAASLLVTELATNAVLHARSTFRIEVLVGTDTVRIAVSDTSPVRPQRKRHGAGAATGRGLGLVALLSSSSGCDDADDADRTAYRKTVWFELPLDPAALPQPGEGALLASA